MTSKTYTQSTKPNAVSLPITVVLDKRLSRQPVLGAHMGRHPHTCVTGCSYRLVPARDGGLPTRWEGNRCIDYYKSIPEWNSFSAANPPGCHPNGPMKEQWTKCLEEAHQYHILLARWKGAWDTMEIFIGAKLSVRCLSLISKVRIRNRLTGQWTFWMLQMALVDHDAFYTALLQIRGHLWRPCWAPKMRAFSQSSCPQRCWGQNAPESVSKKGGSHQHLSQQAKEQIGFALKRCIHGGFTRECATSHFEALWWFLPWFANFVADWGPHSCGPRAKVFRNEQTTIHARISAWKIRMRPNIRAKRQWLHGNIAKAEGAKHLFHFWLQCCYVAG